MRVSLLRLCAALLVARAAAAQTTVTLDTPAVATDTTIRGGIYAATNFDADLLVTRASTNDSYQRRALLDFDTASAVPKGTTVESAVLTMTVHWGGTTSARRVAVYAVTRAFDASQATWDIASSTTPWATRGGDLGPQAALAEVPNTDGAKVSFDVTASVQAALSASSRRTRLALVDDDTATAARQGYRDYYSLEAADPTVRPRLVVTYGTPTTSPKAATLPNFSHAIVIVFENHEYGDVIGNPSTPYFNALAKSYGLGTNYDGIMHPSLPNYMALTGGQTVFTTDCQGCTTSAASVVNQVEQSGRTWRAYMESMPSPCATSDSGYYAQKHNPFVHYAPLLGDRSRCSAHDISQTPLLADLKRGDIADYTWITPNECSDMHSCSIATGDAWLKKYVPAILASPAWDANSVLFIVFDEGTSSTGGGGHTPLIVVSPRVKAGTRVGTRYNHYNLLATIESAWALPRLGHASTAPTMTDFFNR